MATPIDINKATFEELKNIRNIGDKRAKKIIDIRNIKGKITLEDLKIIPCIPSSIWDPLVDEGLIVVPSTLVKTSNVEQSVHAGDTEGSSTQEQDLLKKIDMLKKELVEKEEMIRERESVRKECVREKIL